MADYHKLPKFLDQVDGILEDVAVFSYENGNCGYTAAREFQAALETRLARVSQAPLREGFDWGHPQRKAFFDYNGQYALIYLVEPHLAETNPEVTDSSLKFIQLEHKKVINFNLMMRQSLMPMIF